MIIATQKHYKTGHDEAMDLVRAQTAALQATREELEECRAEIAKLHDALRFYADPDNWISTAVQQDEGVIARITIRQTTAEDL